jgi:hypothetical protein
VLRTGSKPSEYASQLLEMARALRPVGLRLVPTVAMAAPSQLAARLGAILDADRRRPVLGRRLAWMACLASLLIAVPLSAVGPKVPRRAETEMVTSAPGSTPRATHSKSTRQRTIASEPVTTRTRVTTKTAPVTVTTSRSYAAPVIATPPATTKPSSAMPSVTIPTMAADGSEAGPTLAAGPRAHNAERSASASTSVHSTSTKSRSHSSTHIESDGNISLIANDDNRTVQMEAQGKLRFTSDGKGIESLSPGGKFELEETVGSDVRKLQVTNKSGSLQYKYTVNGDCDRMMPRRSGGWQTASTI